MRFNKQKIARVMAYLGKDVETLQMITGLDEAVILSAIRGEQVRPTTAGEIARALNVNVAKIIE